MVQSQLLRAFWIQALALSLLVPGFGCISFFPRTINQPDDGETLKRVESLESRVFELENRLGVPTVIPAMPPSDPPGLMAPQSSTSTDTKSVDVASAGKLPKRTGTRRLSSGRETGTFSETFLGDGSVTVSTRQTEVRHAANESAGDGSADDQRSSRRSGVEHAAGRRSLGE